jgi:hypothetical protein
VAPVGGVLALQARQQFRAAFHLLDGIQLVTGHCQQGLAGVMLPARLTVEVVADVTAALRGDTGERVIQPRQEVAEFAPLVHRPRPLPVADVAYERRQVDRTQALLPGEAPQPLLIFHWSGPARQAAP